MPKKIGRKGNELKPVKMDFTLNMQKRIRDIQFKKRAPRAVREIKRFVQKEMRTKVGSAEGRTSASTPHSTSMYGATAFAASPGVSASALSARRTRKTTPRRSSTVSCTTSPSKASLNFTHRRSITDFILNYSQQQERPPSQLSSVVDGVGISLMRGDASRRRL